MRILLSNKFYYRGGGDCIVTMGMEDLLKSKGHEVAIFAMDYPENIDDESYWDYWDDFWAEYFETDYYDWYGNYQDWDYDSNYYDENYSDEDYFSDWYDDGGYDDGGYDYSYQDYDTGYDDDDAVG